MPLTEKEFQAQFTPLDPSQIYGNVDTDRIKPGEAFSADLDKINPRLNRGNTGLKVMGWDDPWSAKLQPFSHINADDIAKALKTKADVLVLLDRVLMPNQQKLLKYSIEEYEASLKQYLCRDDQEKIIKSFRQSLSVLLVASPDGDGNPHLHLIGDFLKHGTF